MCILTPRELEFLAGLHKSWQKLYWREIVRMLTEDATGARFSSKRTLGLADPECFPNHAKHASDAC